MEQSPGGIFGTYQPFEIQNSPNSGLTGMSPFSKEIQDSNLFLNAAQSLVSPKSSSSISNVNTTQLNQATTNQQSNNSGGSISQQQTPVSQQTTVSQLLQTPTSNQQVAIAQPIQQFNRPVPILQLPTEKQFSAKYNKQKKTPKKLKKQQTEERVWRVLHQDRNYLQEDGDVKIYIKTRRETPSESVDDRLYSSIKYDVLHKVQGKFTKDIPFLLGRIQVVDAETLEEIRKNRGTVLSGVVEAAITPTRDGVFETNMKIQFTDVSYHHDRRKFALKCSYYKNNDLKNPVLVKVSPPFMVYARKPNQTKKPTDKQSARNKRKRDSDTQVESLQPTKQTPGTPTILDQPAQKQQKINTLPPISFSNCSQGFNEFAHRLDELITNNLLTLDNTEKRKAMDLVICKLFQIDNNIRSIIPQQNQTFPQQQENPFSMVKKAEHM